MFYINVINIELYRWCGANKRLPGQIRYFQREIIFIIYNVQIRAWLQNHIQIAQLKSSITNPGEMWSERERLTELFLESKIILIFLSQSSPK